MARKRRKERWLPVEGWPGYHVSNNGVVTGHRGTPLRTEATESGHLRVTFYLKGRPHHRHVQVLVAAAFIGPKPPGMLTCHADGDHTNNHDWNLYYGTGTQNNLDTIAHGRHRTAGISVCLSGLHKFTEENTGWKSGRRFCKACKRLRAHQYERSGAT